MKSTRRTTLKRLGTGLAATGLFGMSSSLISCKGDVKAVAPKSVSKDIKDEILKSMFFQISLGQWSLHKSFFGDSLKGGFGEFVSTLQSDPDSLLRGALDPVNFPSIAKNDFGLDAVEYVNTFYFSKSKDMEFWKGMKSQCDSEGVKSLLIMCDALGDLGDTNDANRKKAIENHYPWVDIAKYLGCHSIRVNAAGKGTAAEVKDAAIQGLGGLTEYGQSNGINIIVENHGSHSSNGEWLASVMKGVNSPYCGTLPDFGNFCIERGEDYTTCNVEYDRYKGMKELMPFAKGVSGKAHDFDAEGYEIHTDFRKVLQIVKDAGYTGYIDIEYEGQSMSEADGIRATKALLEKVGRELS